MPANDAPRSTQSREPNVRGRRDDSRGGRRDSPRHQGGRGESRSPRGFAPSSDRYAFGEEGSGTGPIADAYPDADSGSAVEPLILPGESLSKYRKGDEQPAAAASTHAAAPTVSVTLAPPANLYTVAEGWDGGDVLPGETLSRRRPADSRPEQQPRRDFDRDSRPGRNDRNSRDSRRDSRSNFRNQAEPVRSPEETQHTQPLAAMRRLRRSINPSPQRPKSPRSKPLPQQLKRPCRTGTGAAA